MRFWTPLILAPLTLNQLVSSQWKCDHRVYGRPQLDHCASVLTSMPDATAKRPTAKLVALRKFVEPQYLNPPFARCPNELDAPMEQLPKFWRYKTCRFALAPLATSSGTIINPEPVSTWSFVLKNTHILSTQCPAKRLGGGVIFIAGLAAYPTGDGAMALYLYAVGAPFEVILNNYMITSQALHPPGIDSASNGSLTGVTKNGSLELRWALQNT